MVRILKPWHTNIGKREVKSPKIYIRDTGILHRLLDLDSSSLSFYPYIGHSFEGFAIEQLIALFDADDKSYFWSVHESAELDFLITKGMKKIGFEIKYSDAPKITKSMHMSIEALNLDQLYIITPGDDVFQMNDKITALGIFCIKTLKL
jgi:predicted AAA+ superfamily ATPase